MADVRREKELEERRKTDNAVIGNDHPVRKLLARIRDKHNKVSDVSMWHQRVSTALAGAGDAERVWLLRYSKGIEGCL